MAQPGTRIRNYAERDGHCGIDSGGHRRDCPEACAHDRGELQQTRLCLAGGVALNCVANGRLLREGHLETSDSTGIGRRWRTWRRPCDALRVSAITEHPASRTQCEALIWALGFRMTPANALMI